MVIILSIIAGIIFFFIFLISVEYSRRSKARIQNRMRRLSGEEVEEEEGTPARNFLMNIIKKFAGNLEKQQSESRQEKLNLMMQRANLPLLGMEFLAILVLGGLATFGYTFLVTFDSIAALIVAFVVIALVWGYVHFRISRRQALFGNQLGDTLSMTANAMRTGFSFLQAIELISKEMDDPMGTEFGKVMKEIQLGTPVETALENMGKRVQSSDYDILVTAILIQRQVGGSLAQILDSIAGTIADRIRIRQEVMTLTSQGRFSGYMLMCLPFILAAYLRVVNPQMIDPLFSTDIGHIGIVVALVLEFIGYLVINKIVDIKF